MASLSRPVRKIPGKILLFGEYVILSGSKAIALPLKACGGSWVYVKGRIDPDLKSWFQYLTQQQDQPNFLSINLAGFGKAIGEGLVFESNIPRGYGAGSSGALCAALMESFGTRSPLLPLPALRSGLAMLEGHFHGSSSGLDPLVSYLDQMLLIQPDGEIETDPALASWQQDLTFFLIDTGLPRKTGPLVQLYSDWYTKEAFREKIKNFLVPSTNAAIESLQFGTSTELWMAFKQISSFQVLHFEPMIPLKFRSSWHKGLHSNQFLLKLCGAGGGGYILGLCLSENFAEVKLHLKPWPIIPLDLKT